MIIMEGGCKHKFHGSCILPWLELHSSCPVCRSQLLADESKLSNAPPSHVNRMEDGVVGGRVKDNRFWVPAPWPLNGLFTLAGSQNGGNSSSNVTSSSSSLSSNSGNNNNSHDGEN